MSKEPTCPNHPDRKATMPTLEGKVCTDCFFKMREAKRLKDKRTVVVEAK